LIVTPDWAQSRLGNFCLRKARMRRAARDDLSKKPDASNEGQSRACAVNSARRNPA
jgi:hypothetical protein